VRQSTGEELERLVPPRLLSLEQALEFCATDECVEVTPLVVRLRKTVLDGKERGRMRARGSRDVRDGRDGRDTRDGADGRDI
jgi:GTP-binding protein